MKDNKELVILAGRGGGGSTITVDSAMSASSENPVQNKVIYDALATAAEIVNGKEDIPTTETISDAAASISPAANHIYNCTAAALTSLTITDPALTGAWIVRFVSGSTATVLTVPNDLHMPDGFAVEANKRYEINVSDGYALVASWSTT